MKKIINNNIAFSHSKGKVISLYENVDEVLRDFSIPNYTKHRIREILWRGNIAGVIHDEGGRYLGDAFVWVYKEEDYTVIKSIAHLLFVKFKIFLKSLKKQRYGTK